MSPEQVAEFANVFMLAAPGAALAIAIYALWLLVTGQREFDRAKWYLDRTDWYSEHRRSPSLPPITLDIHPAPQHAQISLLAALIASFALALLLRELLESR